MSKHEDLLDQGPREAPEPETAEQRTKRLSGRAVGGGILGGGAAAAKLGAIGGLGKFLAWLLVWNGAIDVAHVFGAIGVVVLAGLVVAAVVLRHRKWSA